MFSSFADSEIPTTKNKQTSKIKRQTSPAWTSLLLRAVDSWLVLKRSRAPQFLAARLLDFVTAALEVLLLAEVLMPMAGDPSASLPQSTAKTTPAAAENSKKWQLLRFKHHLDISAVGRNTKVTQKIGTKNCKNFKAKSEDITTTISKSKKSPPQLLPGRQCVCSRVGHPRVPAVASAHLPLGSVHWGFQARRRDPALVAPTRDHSPDSCRHLNWPMFGLKSLFCWNNPAL